MKTNLEVHRQKLLNDLAQVTRQIAITKNQLTRLEARIVAASPPSAKAA